MTCHILLWVCNKGFITHFSHFWCLANNKYLSHIIFLYIRCGILHTWYSTYIIFLYIRCGIISHISLVVIFWTNCACAWKASNRIDWFCVWQRDLCSYRSGPNLRLWTVFSVVKSEVQEVCNKSLNYCTQQSGIWQVISLICCIFTRLRLVKIRSHYSSPYSTLLCAISSMYIYSPAPSGPLMLHVV